LAETIYQRLKPLNPTALDSVHLEFWPAARPDLIDDAMTRPGRFDKKIPFLIPNLLERVEIFRVNLMRKHDVAEDTVRFIDLNLLAQLTEGLTGAEIETIVDRGVTMAILGRINKGIRETVQTKHIQEAIKTFIVGERSQRYILMSLLALQSLDDTRFIPDIARGVYFDDNGKPLLKLYADISQLKQRIG
jgi:hypothetical protein